MIRDLTLFQLAKQRMDWAAKREEVIAENVANADTPDYRARDLKDFEFKKMLMSETAAPTVTHPLHVATVAMPATANEVIEKSYETTLSGNSVNLEQQMNNLNDARGAHNMAADIFQKNLKMLRTAMGRLGGS